LEQDTIRAFIAIELPFELKAMIKDFETGLRGPESRCARWVDPESIHLTLKFLGNVQTKMIEPINKALEADTATFQSFTLKTTETGCFPNLQRARVFWLGLGGDMDRLLGLQSTIEGSLADLGIPRELRPFAAHLTLARLKDDCSVDDRKTFASLVGGIQFQPIYTMKVEAVSLIRSRLTPAGAIYTRLAMCGLKGGGKVDR
jgi:RNA 2',3'-cyclic 3'-phosphodiesterase